MRIIHVVRQFHPSIGGLEEGVLELSRAQAAHGHEVRVVTLDRIYFANPGTRLAPTESVDGVEVIRIPFFGSTRYPIAPTVLKFIKHADIVHVHAIDFFFDYLAWTRPFHRIPIVASTHGGYFHTSFAASFKRVYFNVVTRASATWYEAIISGSPADAALFSKISSKVVLIESGVNIQRFAGCSAPVPKKAIITIGRFSINKRLDRLISFVARINAHDPHWTLIIAGGRSDLSADELASLAERAGLRDAVQVIESPTHDNLREIIKGCSVLASSSEYEGFGLTAIEGMSAGLFVLLNDIPVYRRLVTRTGAGMLVDFSNSEEAAETFLRRWKELQDRYEQSRRAAMESARLYEWGPVVERYEQLYEKVIADRK